MRTFLIFIGGAFAAILLQQAIAQNNNPGVIQLNHVGIAVDDVAESIEFYTQTLGFEEAFRVNGDDGGLRLAYLRVSDTTFVELAPATAERPAGLTHFGIHVDDVAAVKAMLERRGATATDVFTGFTKASLSNVYDPQGVQIELSEYPPDSLQGRALAGR